MSSYEQTSRKLEKIELLNKQNELNLSRLDIKDNKILSVNYIKGKIKYEILNRESVDFDNFYIISLYDFPESYIPFINVVSYFDTEAGNYRFINDENYLGYISYSFRKISDKEWELYIRISGYLYDDSNTRLSLYNTAYLQINITE